MDIFIQETAPAGRHADAMAGQGRKIPEALGDCLSLVDVLRMRALHQGSQPAYIFLNDGVDDAVEWTYGQLYARASAIAAELGLRDGRGKRALLLYEPGLDYIAGFLGALMAGTVAVPSYTPVGSRATNRLVGILADAGAEIILTTARIRDVELRLRGDFWATRDVHWIVTEEAPPAAPDAPMPGVGAQDLAVLQYTSGSTGSPKGVMVTHRNLMSNAEAIAYWLRPSSESRGCIWLPPFHDMGLMGGILQPLYQGFPVVLFSPAHFVQQPIRWLRAISRHRSTVTSAPNFAFDLCVNEIDDDELDGLDLSSLSVAFCGAEQVRKETLERFADRFGRYGFRAEALIPCFGMAETTLIVSGKPVGMQPRWLRLDQAALEAGRVVEGNPEAVGAPVLASCGPVVKGLAVRIVDPNTLQPCPADGIGEIWVTGGHVAAGYWGRGADTEQAFRARIEGDDSEYLRTGDLGFMRDGELFVTGRIKDLIIIAGRNHYPQDIEATAQEAHPANQANGVAAFPVEVEGREELILVVEVRRNGKLTSLDHSEIARKIVQAVTSAHRIRPLDLYLGPVGTIPRTTSGKVQRQACKRAYAEGNLRPRLGGARLQAVGVDRE